jgi:phenylalanine-4-hydroxylase
VRKGHKSVIEFVNGFRVEGVVQNIARDRQKIMYITWVDCVVSRGAQVYFEPSWGEFDMPVGEAVTSVFGGPADREAYGEYEMGGVSTQPGRTSPFTEAERRIFDCYTKIRQVRHESASGVGAGFASVAERMLTEHPDEWLLALEILEHTKEQHTLKALETKVFEALIARADRSDKTTADLINKGIKIAGVLD